MAASPSAAGGLIGFWTTYGSVITGGAVLLSALCALLVIFSNRATARRRATLDLILHIESDGDLLRARKQIVALKKSSIKSDTWGTEDQRDSDEATTIRTVLNIDELVAVSIAEGVIDERVYRRWFNRAFIDDYITMSGYIGEVRQYLKNPALFKELENLAKKWQADESFYAQPRWFARKVRAITAVFRA